MSHGVETLNLGATTHGADPGVQMQNTFRQGAICEFLSHEGLKSKKGGPPSTSLPLEGPTCGSLPGAQGNSSGASSHKFPVVSFLSPNSKASMAAGWTPMPVAGAARRWGIVPYWIGYHAPSPFFWVNWIRAITIFQIH